MKRKKHLTLFGPRGDRPVAGQTLFRMAAELSGVNFFPGISRNFPEAPGGRAAPGSQYKGQAGKTRYRKCGEEQGSEISKPPPP